MGAAASCNADQAIPDTIDGQTVPRPPQATYTHQPCRSPEVTFDWPDMQERKTVHAAMERATIAQGDDGTFRIDPG
jgi:hypothetical protein